MGFTYIIEHMEEDEPTPRALPQWVLLEYQHMRTLAGPSCNVHFTHLSRASCDSLSALFSVPVSFEQAQAHCHQLGILDFLNEKQIPIEKVCLLDPKAENELAVEDGDGRFDSFLFGGILGDDPPRDRTSELRTLGFPTRHLGPVQMTTDSAVGVCSKVVDDKVPLSKIPYVDYPTITFTPKESVEMPFRYIASPTSEPLLPPGMKEHLRNDLDRGFEF